MNYELKRRLTQKDHILNHLKQGMSITDIIALNRYGCRRLAARIFEIKEDGYDINTKMIKLPSGVKVACYHIEARK